MPETAGDAQFAIVFEYRLPRDGVDAFEREYGGDGRWARFFSRDPAYLGTELWAFEDDAGRYLVVDRWTSGDAYAAFRARFREEYERRSAETASLYGTERIVGRVVRR